LLAGRLVSESIEVTSIAVRLLVAAAGGAVLGFDRERADKPAGLRTHMLVALGSATFGLAGIDASLDGPKASHADVTRVIQGVAGGMGFLGAGAIIKGRDGVSGLTTAASVWGAGALGLAAGLGAYMLVLCSSLLSLATLALWRFEKNSAQRGSEKEPERKSDSGDDKAE
jgi:putative Mg2+ transporter-C (MgtC) family protein